MPSLVNEQPSLQLPATGPISRHQMQTAIEAEIAQIAKGLNKLERICETYVGDRTKLRVAIEKNKTEIAIWETCLDMLNRLEG
ncbi:MAG: hypothetical protein HC910_18105 [Spirulinaceae cyanobacterium SM2_1_0]|nr:hypothetical protein [Spirulinaceae cyanobacterium SM2_1_0]